MLQKNFETIRSIPLIILSNPITLSQTHIDATVPLVKLTVD
jgi:hypothetical protein